MRDIYFYDHDKPYREFSNFWPSPFSLDGLEWPTVEHYFQAHKTLAPAGQEQIRRAKAPRQARDLGRQVQQRPDWKAVRDGVMLAALRAKFGQNSPWPRCCSGPAATGCTKLRLPTGTGALRVRTGWAGC